MEYPVFILELDENGNPKYGLQDVALVNDPAYKSMFMKFNEQKEMHFSIQNEEQQIVMGAVMIPDRLVYREEKGQPFYVSANRETIFKASQKFASENRNLNVKATHESKENVSDVFIFESFVTDENRVQSVKGFEDLAIGTWFMTMKINNPKVWESVKNGEFNGYSLEALFSLKPITVLNESDMQQLLNAIK
jgi:hypothetical protein